MVDLKAANANGKARAVLRVLLALLVALNLSLIALTSAAQAQSFSFSTVRIDGNQRVDAATILAFAKIGYYIIFCIHQRLYQRGFHIIDGNP